MEAVYGQEVLTNRPLSHGERGLVALGVALPSLLGVAARAVRLATRSHGRGPRRPVGSFVASGDSANSRPADQRSLEHRKACPRAAGGLSRPSQHPRAALAACVRTFTHGSAYCGTWLSADLGRFRISRCSGAESDSRALAAHPALPPVFSTLWWPSHGIRCPYPPQSAVPAGRATTTTWSARSLPSSSKGSGT